MIKRLFIVLTCVILLVVILLTGCGGPSTAKDGDTVQVHYTGKLQDGTVFDTSVGSEPLEFTVGQGRLIPGFEQAVIGMQVGESKTVTIPVDQAYGPRRDDMVLEVDRYELPEGLEPEIGMQLQMNQGDGSTIIVTIINVSDTTVTLDANSPLAGQDLTFDIELIEIVVNPSKGLDVALEQALSNGKPTIAEFGSSTCAPCKQMRSILESLAVEYEGKVNVLIVDVYEQRELTQQYKIMAMPTQVFFDANGKEVFRHTGVFPKEDILSQLKSMGIE